MVQRERFAQQAADKAAGDDEVSLLLFWECFIEQQIVYTVSTITGTRC
jgi:lysyl-tRNA synthetase class II